MTSRTRKWNAGALSALLLVAGAWLPGADAAAFRRDDGLARLIFVKVFPGSQPEYSRVEVAENGAALFRGGTAREPGEPESFQVSSATTEELFRRAAELNNFRDLALETSRRIARMGEKTFTYEKGGERWEVSYNYTQNTGARELQAMFESIARARHLRGRLQYHLIYDRLGVLEVLRQMDRELSQGDLLEVEDFAPVLEKIVRDTRLMRLARNIARRLLLRLQDGAARLQLEFRDTEKNHYISLILYEDGNGTLENRRMDEKADLRPVKMPSALAARFWELVRLSGGFQQVRGTSDMYGRFSGYRLTYEKGFEKVQLSFAGPPSAPVAEVVHIFRRIVRQDKMLAKVRAALEKNPFMVQVVLQELERALFGNELSDPAEFVPLLEGIVNEESRHEIERNLARRMLERIRSAG